MVIKTCENQLSWFQWLKDLLIKTFVFYVVNFKSVAAVVTLKKRVFLPPFVKHGLSNLCATFWAWNYGIGIWSDVFQLWNYIYICIKSICNNFKISVCYALYEQEIGTHVKHQ